MSIDISRIELPPRFRLDCYRASIYPILKYYNLDADILMLTFESHLGFNDFLLCDTLEVVSFKKLFSDFCVEQKFVESSGVDDIIPVIKNAIDNDYFVLCFLDVFFYSSFKSVYQKIHTSHGFPMFGYDDDTMKFMTIDSDYLESFRRIFAEVTYDDIRNGTRGYEQIKNLYSIHLIKQLRNTCFGPLTKDKVRQKYVAQYLHNVTSRKSSDNSCQMNHLINYVSLYCSSKEDMIEFSRRSYKHIDQFINSRMLEYYGIPCFVKDTSYLQQVIASTVEACNYVRSIMYRTLYTGEYRRQSFEKFPYYFDKIIKNEQERIRLFGTIDSNEIIRL